MDSTGANDLPTGTMNGALRTAMDRGAQVARAAGEKWTPSRARVYELLVLAGGPVRAYDLIPEYSSGRNTRPPTIYRALEFLESLGLVHRIPSLSRWVARRFDGAPNAAAFVICGQCGLAEEVIPKLSSLVEDVSDERRFELRSATLEIYGKCQACRSAEAQSARLSRAGK